MKLLNLIVVICGLLLPNATAYFYPPLFWHKDNCGFRKLQENTNSNGTKEYFIPVIPNSGMNVVCPNYVTVNSWLREAGISVSDPTLFENMWLVDKQGYDNCVVNEKGDPEFNKLFLLCDKTQNIKYKSLIFHPNFNDKEPKFKPGQHYYFISTSQGYRTELSTRKVSGSYGSCQRYHMKLHIYVCDPKKEDCLWEIPRCGPPADLLRDMLSIDGKLPGQIPKPPTLPVVRPIITLKTTSKTIKTTVSKTHLKDTKKPTTKTSSFRLLTRKRICENKENGMSTQLILNFVLGGVALFMAVVIIILVCGLSGKSKRYTVDRPTSTVPSTHEPGNYIYAETVRYSDGHTQVSLVSPTPPTSPNFIVQPVVHYSVQQQPGTSQSSDTDRQHFNFPTDHRQSSEGASTTADVSTTKSGDEEKPQSEAV